MQSEDLIYREFRRLTLFDVSLGHRDCYIYCYHYNLCSRRRVRSFLRWAGKIRRAMFCGILLWRGRFVTTAFVLWSSRSGCCHLCACVFFRVRGGNLWCLPVSSSECNVVPFLSCGRGQTVFICPLLVGHLVLSFSFRGWGREHQWLA